MGEDRIRAGAHECAAEEEIEIERPRPPTFFPSAAATVSVFDRVQPREKLRGIEPGLELDHGVEVLGLVPAPERSAPAGAGHASEAHRGRTVEIVERPTQVAEGPVDVRAETDVSLGLRHPS
jgi:hypothetical protein